MQQNLKAFVENRREVMKRGCFYAVFDLARTDDGAMEMLQLSGTLTTKLRSTFTFSFRHTDKNFRRNIADIVLIGMSKNQQHVKASATHSRKSRRLVETIATAEQTDDVT